MISIMLAASLFASSDEQTLMEIRLRALSQIESGDNDNAIGSRCEVSRYQIMPTVWHRYSASHRYSSKSRSTVVATLIATERVEAFKQRFGDEPSHVEFYILWNAPAYLSKSRDLIVIPSAIMERARRFDNLTKSMETK